MGIMGHIPGITGHIPGIMSLSFARYQVTLSNIISGWSANSLHLTNGITGQYLSHYALAL